MSGLSDTHPKAAFLTLPTSRQHQTGAIQPCRKLVRTKKGHCIGQKYNAREESKSATCGAMARLHPSERDGYGTPLSPREDRAATGQAPQSRQI